LNALTVKLKLAATLAAAALLWFAVDVPAAFAALAATPPAALAAAGAVYALVYVANAAKIRLLLPEQSFMRLFVVTLSSQAWAFLLPGQLAVEAARALRLGRSDDIGGARAASAVAFDKLTALAAVLISMLGGAAVETARDGGALAAAAAALLLVLAAAGWGMAHGVVERAVDGWLRRTGGIGASGRAAAAAVRFIAAWRENARRPGRAAGSLAWGCAVQGLQAVGCWVLGVGMGLSLGPAAWCVVIGGLTVALLAPVTIAGVGVREASLIGLMGMYGVSAESAVAVAMALLGFQVTFSLLGLGLDLAGAGGTGLPAPPAVGHKEVRK
jgi:glycosyltransferase 2 family protein